MRQHPIGQCVVYTALVALFLGGKTFAYLLGDFQRGLGSAHPVLRRHLTTRLQADGASANELSITGSGNNDKNKDSEVDFPYDDFGMNHEEELDEDALFEREMAREMFDMLRGEDDELSVDDFMKWDDIKDVLEAGIIDQVTMTLIVESIGVKKSMTFEQWLDTVELVNQVQLALEGVDCSVQDWDPMTEQEKVDAAYGKSEDNVVDPTTESVKQMLRMFGLKPIDEETH